MPRRFSAFGLALALNHATADQAVAEVTAIALNAESGAPDWIQVVPAGPQLTGRDGRKFRMLDAAAVLEATKTLTGLPLVVDYDHATEKPELAANGVAAGWIEELDLRDGSIWGRVVWTPKGKERVAGREYRFVSPVLVHSRNAEQDVVALASVGLVHRPNFTTLKALNNRETRMDPTLKAFLDALGLPETTSLGDAVAAVKTAKAANAAGPDLTKYVPRAQYEETVTALNAANGKLETIEQASARAKAEALIEDAVKAGKITPSTKAEYLVAALNNFDITKGIVDKLPVIVKPGESDQARRAEAEVGADGKVRLTDGQKAICRSLGLSEDDYAKSLAA